MGVTLEDVIGTDAGLRVANMRRAVEDGGIEVGTLAFERRSSE